MDLMSRGVTSQMKEPEDDVTWVAAFITARLVVPLVLGEAGLVCGAALCSKEGWSCHNMLL